MTVGKTFGLLDEKSAALVKAFDTASTALIDRGKELLAYSPELVAANARAEIRNIQSDVREAQVLGPESPT